jgi:hypothetical protein
MIEFVFKKKTNYHSGEATNFLFVRLVKQVINSLFFLFINIMVVN